MHLLPSSSANCKERPFRMSAIGKALTSACVSLYNAGLRAPWLLTGIRSIPEYLHYMPSGLEYRKNAPGTPTVTAIIPHDSPSLVYSTKYWGRDYRRNNKYVPRTVDAKTPLDLDKMFASAPLKPEDVKDVPRPLVMPTRGF